MTKIKDDLGIFLLIVCLILFMSCSFIDDELYHMFVPSFIVVAIAVCAIYTIVKKWSQKQKEKTEAEEEI